MRKLIIDTDTGSDDAVALLMALRSPEVEVLGITTVGGNVPLEQATQNALMTVEVCGSRVPVYKGAAKPLFRELVTAVNVHGRDGMGDLDLIHPQSAAQATHAVDYLIETVRANPGEVEIVTIGPATNLALAMLKEPQVMRRTKHIWSMGTAGFGPGNTTPVAEFNVYVDAESYAVLLNGGVPLTIVGIDQCKGNAVWTAQDMEEIRVGSRVGALRWTATACCARFKSGAAARISWTCRTLSPWPLRCGTTWRWTRPAATATAARGRRRPTGRSSCTRRAGCTPSTARNAPSTPRWCAASTYRFTRRGSKSCSSARRHNAGRPPALRKGPLAPATGDGLKKRCPERRLCAQDTAQFTPQPQEGEGRLRPADCPRGQAADVNFPGSPSRLSLPGTRGGFNPAVFKVNTVQKGLAIPVDCQPFLHVPGVKAVGPKPGLFCLNAPERRLFSRSHSLSFFARISGFAA